MNVGAWGLEFGEVLGFSGFRGLGRFGVWRLGGVASGGSGVRGLEVWGFAFGLGVRSSGLGVLGNLGFWVLGFRLWGSGF